MSLDVIPAGDLIPHEPGPNCVCGPEELVARTVEDGLVIGRIQVHHSLDGREQDE